MAEKLDVSTSGIQIDENPVQVMRTTMKLSRDMGMAQKRKKSWPKPQGEHSAKPTPSRASPKYSIAYGNSVACPNCEMEFEILPEYYGALAECEECNYEFTIVPPDGSADGIDAAPPTPEERSFSRLSEQENMASQASSVPQKNSKGNTGLVIFVTVTIIFLLALVGVLTYFLLKK